MFDSSVISVNILHFTIVTYMRYLGGGSYRAEHGNRPIFSREFGHIAYIFAYFGNFVFWRTKYDKVTILRTLILLKQNCNSSSKIH